MNRQSPAHRLSKPGIRAGVITLAALVAGNPARAQTECGSVEQAWEQVTAYIVGVPFGEFGAWGGVAGAYVGLEGFESPGDMVKRCMEEAMPTLPAVDDPANYPVGGEEEEEGFWSWLFGDPHLSTLDDRYYDFHGAGDYVLLAHAGGDAEIQGRFVRAVDPRAAVARSLAVRVGDRIVTFHEEGDDDPDPVRIDGQVVPFLDAGTYQDEDLHVHRFRQWLMVRFRNGVSVATVGGRTIQVRIPAAWSGEVSGLLGNADGDPANDVARRDGTLVDPRDSDAVYAGFLDDWFVDPGRSLFTTPFEAAEHGPIRPQDVVTLTELPANDIVAATDVCMAVGLSSGPALDGCVFDVALTGDPSWATADNAAVGSRPSAGVARGADISDAGVLTLGSPLEIDAATTARRLRWSLANPGAGDWFVRNVDLRPAADDTGSVCAARWILLGEDDAALANGTLCIDVPRLDSSGALAFAADVPAGFEGSIFVGAVAAGADVDAELGDRLHYDGELQSQGQVDRYTFTVEPGTRVMLLDPTGDNACGMSWRVAAGNEELFRGGSCFDTEPLAVAAGGEVAVSVDAGTSPGRYAVEIVRVPPPRTSPLRFGVPLDASIGTPGAVARFTFAAAAGDELMLADPDGTNNDCDIVWRIVGPGEAESVGAELFSGAACFDTGPVAISAAGDYTLEVDGRRATTGPVSVAVFRVPAPRSETLRFGESVDASIESPGARVRLEFDGDAGEEIRLSNPAGNNRDCNIVWRILGPDADADGSADRIFEGPVCFDTAPIPLRATGRHVLEIAGRQARTGAVALLAERL